MNWYDWNYVLVLMVFSTISRRDWSAWIDTIETSSEFNSSIISSTVSGLICMNWYDWNHTQCRVCCLCTAVGIDLHELIRLKLLRDIDLAFAYIPTSGLICMNWYDWNYTLNNILNIIVGVGIDLHELIRLKRLFHTAFCSLQALVGIDLHELIRLKRALSSPQN